MPPKKEIAAPPAADDVVEDWDKVKPWNVGEKILCSHVSNVLYEAKIILLAKAENGEPVYTVHYQGWNSRFDEQIPHTEAKERFRDYTPENVELSKQQQADIRNQASKKKSKSRKTEETIRTEGSASRGSTPNERERASRDTSVSLDTTGGTKPASRKGKRSAAGGGGEERSQSPPSAIEASPKSEVRLPIPDVLKRILIEDNNMISQNRLFRIPARVTVADIIDEYSKATKAPRDRDEIFVEYDETANTLITKSACLIESANGLVDYFNVLLGTQLLYKFERQQYLDLLERAKREKLMNLGGESTGSSTPASTPTPGPSSAKRRRKEEVIAEESASDTKQNTVLEDSKTLCPAKTYGLPHLLRLFVRFEKILACTNWSDRSLQLVINNVTDFMVFIGKNHEKYFKLAEDYEAAGPEYVRRAYS